MRSTRPSRTPFQDQAGMTTRMARSGISVHGRPGWRVAILFSLNGLTSITPVYSPAQPGQRKTPVICATGVLLCYSSGLVPICLIGQSFQAEVVYPPGLYLVCFLLVIRPEHDLMPNLIPVIPN